MDCVNKVRNIRIDMTKKLISNYQIMLMIIFYACFHFFIHPDYWDDVYFSGILQKYDFNIFNYTLYRYETWSSRIFLEICLAIIGFLPNWVWKILDVLVIALLYRELEWLLNSFFKIDKKQIRNILPFLICAYPFSTMASTGWMATTMNYLWVVSLGLYAINKILKAAVLKAHLSKREYVFTILAVLYSASFESMTVILFLILAATVVYQKCIIKEKIAAIQVYSLAIVILLLVYIILCPGNRLRPGRDAETWMPQFFELTMLDKFRMGTVTAFLHFVSIPSAIFFILSVICGIGTIFYKREYWKRAIACMPVIIDAVWSIYYMFCYLTGRKAMTYQVPSPLLGGEDSAVQIGIMISLAIWLGAVFCSMKWMLLDDCQWRKCIGVLLIGCIPEVIVGMTPTVVTSMLRTTIYLYVAMIVIIVCLWEKLQPERYKLIKWFLNIVLGCGCLLNMVQMIRHILLYG